MKKQLLLTLSLVVFICFSCKKSESNKVIDSSTQTTIVNKKQTSTVESSIVTNENTTSSKNQVDKVIFNNTKVIEARILFQKSTGGTIEIFCLEPAAGVELTQAMMSRGSVRWTCLVGGAGKWKQPFLEKLLTTAHGQVLLKAEKGKPEQGAFEIEFSWDNSEFTFAELLHYAGVLPLPPYLQRQSEAADYDRYQTVYARHEGSVAAPTAGLHFTPQLLHQLQEKGIRHQFVTLHVGAGTFQPVKSERMQDHPMHREWIEITKADIENLIQHSSDPVIPVGTTSLRTIESLYWMGVKAMLNPAATLQQLEVQQWEAYDLPLQTATAAEALKALLGWMEQQKTDQLICHTQILIAPGYRLRIATALITNFHQPNSTLLLLVAALLGDEWKNIEAFWQSPHTMQPPEGESLTDFAARVIHSWESLIDNTKPGHKVIICHGGVIRILIAHLLQLDWRTPALFKQLHIDYASCTRIEIGHYDGALPIVKWIGVIASN